MDTAIKYWMILQELETDLANKVCSFMVIGEEGNGVLMTTEDGLAYWFGKMRFGLTESRTANEPTPLDVPGIVSMAQGDSHIVLVNRRGDIYTMGKNFYGQLGLGTADQQTHFSPQLISSPHKFTSVRCGEWHSVALTDDGKVWTWGWNDFGHIGVPMGSSTRSIPSPRQIFELDCHRVVAVECGGHHSLALTDRGEVYTWGWNEWGQLGDGSVSGTGKPPTRIPTSSPVKSMAAGSSHTLLLTQTGEVFACGKNDCGQLGLPMATKFSTRMVKVADLPPISQIASHLATNMSIAISSDQRCFIWGQFDSARLDDEIPENVYISISTPLQLNSDYSTVDSALGIYSLHTSTPHSVILQETSPNRLSTRMSRMFDNLETSNVQFVVEQRTIHVNQNILSNSTDYFARMFSARWMSPEDPIAKVTIPDYSYEAFHAFLRFLYTDYLEVHFDLYPELFELASQYLVPELQQLCLSRMRLTLTPVTCCLYYPLTQRHSLPELVDFEADLIQFASTRMSEVINSPAYQSIEQGFREKLANPAQNFLGTSNVNSSYKRKFD